VDTIKQHIRQVADWPELGTAREELAPGLRSLVAAEYRRYLILYRRTDAIEIVRVLDGSRDLKSILDRKRPQP